MVDQFTKSELRVRLRQALFELDKVCDEIIATYLDEREDEAKSDNDLSSR